MKVKFKKFNSRATIPQKVTIGSACYGLLAAKSLVLEVNASRSVETDLRFFFKKYVAEIFPIFSLSIIPEINTR